MSLLEYRDKYQSNCISKPDYIEKMHEFHFNLFEYTQFIKDTDINKIEIKNSYLVIELKNKIRFICNTVDKREAPFEILNFNVYEKEDSNMIFNLLKPNMVFFDIGSNVGWYSLNVAKKDKSITVYSFEPIPRTFLSLKKNIEFNALKNIFAYNLGFYNEDKQADFYFDCASSGSTSLKNLLSNEKIKRVTSQLIKLDHFFYNEQMDKLDFIKCDVEGAELLVFQGAIEILEKYKPIVFSELLRKWSEKFNYHPNRVIQLFSQLGYRAFFVKVDKLIEITALTEETVETNFFFLHEKKHYSQIAQWCL